jgi:hypothetical protein
MWLAALAVLSLAVASEIKSDEEVVFFPTCAALDAAGTLWTAQLRGWIYEPERDDTKRTQALKLLARSLGLKEDAMETAVFRERARLFLVDNERGKEVAIRLGDKTHTLPESDASGHFRGPVSVSAAEVKARLGGKQNGWMSFDALTREGDTRRFRGWLQCVPHKGLSVISDIDDTVKVTQVRDKAALVANTFLLDFRAVAGMAELYGGWVRQGAVFHYVSASPWQLYGPLEEFREKSKLPAGTFHLKDFRPKDASFFNLFASPEQTKRAAVVPLFEAFAQRKFVLVGDSGEKDPEIYGALAREFPGQVVRIFIRDVTNEAADSERYQKAFAGVPKETWQVFRDPKEVKPLAASLFE